MSNFQLSKQADPNKIFLTKFNELEGRFDPDYYKPLYKNIEDKIQAENTTKSLYEIANVLSGSTPAKSDYSSSKTKYPIIKVGSYQDNFISLSKVAYTKTQNSALAIKDDIYILSSAHQASYVGRFMKYLSDKPKENTAFVGELLCIRGLEKNHKYLFSILNTEIYQTLINREKRGQTSHIYPKDIQKIKIPIPSKNIQANIVAKMDKAYQNKKDKETQAQSLLDNIDDYLLGELGIDLPKQTDNSLKARIFTKKFSEVVDGRFDAEYYQKHYEKINSSIKNCNFKYYPICDISQAIESGHTPAKIDYSDTKTNYPIIKVKSYKGDFISFNKLDFTYKKNKIYAEKNDIFILSSAHQASYVGRFIKFLKTSPPQNTSFVGELICIRANKNTCHPMYLFSLLNMEVYKTLLNREKRGQTSHIYPKDIKLIIIPLPPIEKQNEIAEHISQIRDQAKQLQFEAKTELEQAKQEIETMILGSEK